MTDFAAFDRAMADLFDSYESTADAADRWLREVQEESERTLSEAGVTAEDRGSTPAANGSAVTPLSDGAREPRTPQGVGV